MQLTVPAGRGRQHRPGEIVQVKHIEFKRVSEEDTNDLAFVELLGIALSANADGSRCPQLREP